MPQAAPPPIPIARPPTAAIVWFLSAGLHAAVGAASCFLGLAGSDADPAALRVRTGEPVPAVRVTLVPAEDATPRPPPSPAAPPAAPSPMPQHEPQDFAVPRAAVPALAESPSRAPTPPPLLGRIDPYEPRAASEVQVPAAQPPTRTEAAPALRAGPAPAPALAPPEVVVSALAPPKPLPPRDAGPAAAAPSEPSPPAKPEPGAASEASTLDPPAPVYPPASRRRGEQGLVVLEVEVLADGRAGDVRVVETPGYPRLVDAAVRAVRQAAFRPATRGGRPVPSVLRLRIRFVLE